jgi:Zn-dependent protease with chaperone function
MSELLFPTFGTLAIVVVLLPLCALAGLGALHVLDRWGGKGVGRQATARYLLLVVPTLLPLVWSISAGLHQAETGRSVLACLLAHDLHEICAEPLLFAALMTAFVVARTWRCLSLLPRLGRSVRTGGARAQRVARIVAAHAGLAPLRERVLVVRDGWVGGSATLGIFRPVVALDADFVDRCDDETLVGALAHELSHLTARDPVRYFLLALVIQVNPLGRLLRREAAAWIYRRELGCDRAAVLHGATPFGVARALLAAARPRHCAMAHIRGGGTKKLRLRVELLLSYAEARPRDGARGSWALALAAAVGLVALAGPHVGGTDPLDALHTGVERIAAHLVHDTGGRSDGS